jgi:ribosomal protein L23
MARKEDKLRPYRVDYFDIEEMKFPDLALMRSAVVRAVTATEASHQVIEAPEAQGRILIRAYRFYKKLGAHKKDVYKAVEDLFSSNKAVKVMETVENYRATARRRAEIDAHFRAAAADPTVQKAMNDVYKTVVPDDVPVPTTGPESPATQAVMTDYRGMFEHDKHEQLMDHIIIDPQDRRVPDLSNTIDTFDFATQKVIADTQDKSLPVAEHGDDIAHALTAVEVQPPREANVSNEYSLGQKILIFGAAAVTVVLAILIVLHSH